MHTRPEALRSDLLRRGRLHAICDSWGRPLGDRGHDTDWLRDEQKDNGIRAPPVKSNARGPSGTNGAATNAGTVTLVTLLCKAKPSSMRHHVRQTQGFAACRNPIRRMPHGLSHSHRPRRNHHAFAMCSAPKSLRAACLGTMDADWCTSQG